MCRTTGKRMFRGWTWVIAMMITVWWSDPAHAILLDFDTDGLGNPIVARQIIDDEYASLGVMIQTANAGSPDLGVAFNSASPTGGDDDLGTPGTIGNAMSESFGNILIIQENGGASNGMINVDPDDEGSRPAGYHTFTFGRPITSVGFVLIDIEGPEEIMDGANPTSGLIKLFDDGTLVGKVSFAHFIDPISSFYDPSVMFGNNSVNRIDPILASDFGAASFNQVVFSFGGSGGLDEVTFAPVPEPGTLLLIGSGLVGLGMGTRRRNRKQQVEG